VFLKWLLNHFNNIKGGMHAHKAQYIRLAYNTPPADIVQLMERVWCVRQPRLIISVHGGMADFDFSDQRLGARFCQGILKAAVTTGFYWLLDKIVLFILNYFYTNKNLFICV
jgi:hypothetical protein